MRASVKDHVLAMCWHIMKPIMRMLIKNGIMYREFADLSKRAYVAVATQDYGRHGRPTNISRVALLTGLDRKEIKRVRDGLSGEPPARAPVQDRISRVLSGWHQDADFLDADGQPLELAPDGPSSSFGELMRRYGGDVPVGAMLGELKNVHAVEETTYGRLRVLTRYHMPAQFDPALLRHVGISLHDLGTTLDHNLTREPAEEPRFEGRAANAFIDAAAIPAFREFLESNGQRFLENVDDWLSTHETTTDSAKKTARLGVGVYLIEESDSKKVK